MKREAKQILKKKQWLWHSNMRQTIQMAVLKYDILMVKRTPEQYNVMLYM